LLFNDNGSFPLALLEIFLFFAWFMCMFWIFGDIFRSKDLGGVGKTVCCVAAHPAPWMPVATTHRRASRSS